MVQTTAPSDKFRCRNWLSEEKHPWRIPCSAHDPQSYLYVYGKSGRTLGCSSSFPFRFFLPLSLIKVFTSRNNVVHFFSAFPFLFFTQYISKKRKSLKWNSRSILKFHKFLSIRLIWNVNGIPFSVRLLCHTMPYFFHTYLHLPRI